jgi:hypothetical protein
MTVSAPSVVRTLAKAATSSTFGAVALTLTSPNFPPAPS